MKVDMKFREFLAQYCDVKPQDMREDMRLVEDLGLSSFDLMSLLGDMEDNFDVELNSDTIGNVTTIGEAVALISDNRQSA